MDPFCRVKKKIMYVLSWRTVSALTRVLFWCLFPSLLRNSGNKHQNNSLVGAETVRHSSTYIILYVYYCCLWTHWPSGNEIVMLKVWFSNSSYIGLSIYWVFFIVLMLILHWWHANFGSGDGLGAVRKQAIAWACWRKSVLPYDIISPWLLV